MPILDPLSDYPRYRAYNPGATLADLMAVPGVPGVPGQSLTPANLASLLTGPTGGPQVAMGVTPAHPQDQSQLIDAMFNPNSPYRLSGPEVGTLPTPQADHRKHSASGGPMDPIDALLAQLFGNNLGGGGGSNPVTDEIQRQIGLLQQQAGASKQDLLKHEKMAGKDLRILYRNLGRFIKNSSRENKKDLQQNIHLLNKDYSKGIRDTQGNYADATENLAAEAERLGLDPGNAVAYLNADKVASVENLRGSRRDLRADAKAQRRDWKNVARQMRMDAKMERNVQIGQVHRDTTQALSDLSNTLQAQLGQLRMARAQATSSGANPLDVLTQEADLAKKLLDIKAAQKELATGKSSSSGDASKGFQSALDYLMQQKQGGALASVLQKAEYLGSAPSTAGSSTDISSQPFFWKPDDRKRIIDWMGTQLKAKGITPTEQIMNELMQALRLNWGL